jgi:hypothetical protein
VVVCWLGVGDWCLRISIGSEIVCAHRVRFSPDGQATMGQRGAQKVIWNPDGQETGISISRSCYLTIVLSTYITVRVALCPRVLCCTGPRTTAQAKIDLTCMTRVVGAKQSVCQCDPERETSVFSVYGIWYAAFGAMRLSLERRCRDGGAWQLSRLISLGSRIRRDFVI